MSHRQLSVLCCIVYSCNLFSNVLYCIPGQSRHLFQEEMKHGHVESLVGKVLFLGAAGSGKTSSKHPILNEPPPTVRISTQCAERPVKIVRIEVDGLKFKRLQAKEEKIIVAKIIKARAAGRLQKDSKKSTGPKPTQKVNHTSPPPSPNINGERANERRQMSPWSQPSSPLKHDSSTDVVTILESPSSQPSSPMKHDSSTDIIAVLERLSATEDEFVDLIERSSGLEALMKVEMVQITDTGGQPQFHEVLPAFLRGMTTGIFVQKLSECLDDHPQVEYYDENGTAVCTPYHSAKTNMQILKHCIWTMRTFRCQKGRDNPHKLVFIGTFKDREHESLETREIKNKTLVEMLLPAFENEVVYNQLDRNRKELIFPWNARFPEKTNKE